MTHDREVAAVRLGLIAATVIWAPIAFACAWWGRRR